MRKTHYAAYFFLAVSVPQKFRVSHSISVSKSLASAGEPPARPSIPLCLMCALWPKCSVPSVFSEISLHRLHHSPHSTARADFGTAIARQLPTAANITGFIGYYRRLPRLLPRLLSNKRLDFGARATHRLAPTIPLCLCASVAKVLCALCVLCGEISLYRLPFPPFDRARLTLASLRFDDFGIGESGPCGLASMLSGRRLWYRHAVLHQEVNVIFADCLQRFYRIFSRIALHTA